MSISRSTHQFLKLDRIIGLEPEELKYHSLREHLIDARVVGGRGPHLSLDVTKIVQKMKKLYGDDPGWRIFLQGYRFDYKLGSLIDTLQRDAAEAKMYGVAPPAIYPPRPNKCSSTGSGTPIIYRGIMPDGR